MELQSFHFGNYELHVSLERRKEEDYSHNLFLSRYIKHIIMRLLGAERQLFYYYMFIHKHMLQSDNKTIGVLDAHGFDWDDDWKFEHNGSGKSVQDWINQYDGTYPVLFVHVCNPGNYVIYSQSALVVFPRTDLSVYGQLEKTVKVDIYIPRRGLFDLVNIDREYLRRYSSDIESDIQAAKPFFMRIIESPGEIIT